MVNLLTIDISGLETIIEGFYLVNNRDAYIICSEPTYKLIKDAEKANSAHHTGSFIIGNNGINITSSNYNIPDYQKKIKSLKINDEEFVSKDNVAVYDKSVFGCKVLFDNGLGLGDVRVA